MTLAELMTTCNATGIRLGIHDSGLRVNAPKGTLTAEIRDALAEFKPILLAALAQLDSEREAIQWVERLTPSEGYRVLEEAFDELAEITGTGSQSRAQADPIFPLMTNWLWRIAAISQGESITDSTGHRWDVMNTTKELILAEWSQEWLTKVEPFYNAVLQSRSNYPTAEESRAFFQRQRLTPADQLELGSILSDFTDGADAKDQARASAAWDRLNTFNARTGQAKPSKAPQVGGTAHA